MSKGLRCCVTEQSSCPSFRQVCLLMHCRKKDCEDRCDTHTRPHFAIAIAKMKTTTITSKSKEHLLNLIDNAIAVVKNEGVHVPSWLMWWVVRVWCIDACPRKQPCNPETLRCCYVVRSWCCCRFCCHVCAFIIDCYLNLISLIFHIHFHSSLDF